MKYTILKTSAFILISIFPTGCATVFTAGLQTIPVITEPTAAKVIIYNSKNNVVFEGETPCKITLRKIDLIGGKMIISKYGFKNIEIKIGQQVDGCFWGNICIGIFPGLIDIITGNWKMADVGGVLIKLEELKTVYNNKNGLYMALSHIDQQKNAYSFSIEKINDLYLINIDSL